MTGSVALVIGASRGLGFELAKSLHTRGTKVYATVRSPPKPQTFPGDIHVIEGVDVGTEQSGKAIGDGFLENDRANFVIINAGVFKTETLNKPNFADEVEMYKTVAIGPVFIAHHLVASNRLAPNAKIILITTEGGSIALRTKEEGGGNYGHHGSKAAANMVGKLLANDLFDKGIAVVMIHPGFMRTDMTKGVGFDKYWESGGAVTPAEAAVSALDFIETVTMEHTGTFWAPRGARDIGEAERVLGKNLPTPLQLPW